MVTIEERNLMGFQVQRVRDGWCNVCHQQITEEPVHSNYCSEECYDQYMRKRTAVPKRQQRFDRMRSRRERLAERRQQDGDGDR